jgi:hypothetical protein
MTYQQPYPFMTSSMLLAHMNPNRASVDRSVGSDYLDPELRCSSTPSHVMSSWEPAHGLPFPGEHEGILYTPPMPDYNLSTCKGTTPPMPTSVPLKQEPASGGYPPSDCSSVFSPKESDYERGPSPSTPLDDMSLPYFHAYCEPWDSQSQLLHFPSMANGCVKLDDVHPYQDLFASCSSEERDVKLPIRSCSTPSDRSVLDHDWQAQSNPLQPMRVASPPDETPIKEEIRIPSVYPQGYHPYDTDEEEGAGLTDAVATQQLVRDGDEGDAIYAPDSRYPRVMSSQHRDVRGKKRASTSQPTQSKKMKLEPNNPAHKAGRTGFTCAECPDASFKDASGLQNHIKKQHTRPFTCVFGFAGCESTFAAKNEWKRHVASQHLVLNYWLCCQGTCAKISNSNPSSAQVFSGYGAAPPALPNGAIFNRKDLYTQHVRRMHVPPALKKQIKQKKTVQEWEERIQTLQSEAHKLRCDLPQYMVCPAPQCGAQFHGANAWDERMEHVAKHLDKAAAGLEEPTAFGGPGDQTLTLWAARPDVAIVVPSATPSGYAMNNPLRPDKVSRARVQPVAGPDYEGDEDAEGEEVDE